MKLPGHQTGSTKNRFEADESEEMSNYGVRYIFARVHAISGEWLEDYCGLLTDLTGEYSSACSNARTVDKSYGLGFRILSQSLGAVILPD